MSVTMRSLVGMALLASLAAPGQAAATTVNVALAANGGSAVESSSSWGANASLAIDGNTNGNFFSGSVTHTLDDPQAFWQVNLSKAASVASVVVWNRTDCCGDRLSPFNLQLFSGANPVASFDNVTFAENVTAAGSSGMAFDLAGAVGDLVRIQLAGTNYLSLAEVQVFSEVTHAPLPGALWLLGSALFALPAVSRRRGRTTA